MVKEMQTPWKSSIGTKFSLILNLWDENKDQLISTHCLSYENLGHEDINFIGHKQKQMVNVNFLQFFFALATSQYTWSHSILRHGQNIMPFLMPQSRSSLTRWISKTPSQFYSTPRSYSHSKSIGTLWMSLLMIFNLDDDKFVPTCIVDFQVVQRCKQWPSWI